MNAVEIEEAITNLAEQPFDAQTFPFAFLEAFGNKPVTIADLYAPASEKHKGMPDDLRRAHEHNDEVLERIYIGRRFKNDTGRLEKLFDLYSKMTADKAVASK